MKGMNAYLRGEGPMPTEVDANVTELTVLSLLRKSKRSYPANSKWWTSREIAEELMLSHSTAHRACTELNRARLLGCHYSGITGIPLLWCLS